MPRRSRTDTSHFEMPPSGTKQNGRMKKKQRRKQLQQTLKKKQCLLLTCVQRRRSTHHLVNRTLVLLGRDCGTNCLSKTTPLQDLVRLMTYQNFQQCVHFFRQLVRPLFGVLHERGRRDITIAQEAKTRESRHTYTQTRTHSNNNLHLEKIVKHNMTAFYTRTAQATDTPNLIVCLLFPRDTTTHKGIWPYSGILQSPMCQ